MSEEQLVTLYFRMVALLALGALGGGAVFYHFTEKLNWVDSFYFCTITLTTIGYGDIVPHTEAGKIFTTFYVILGVGILGAFINLFIRRAAIKQRNKHKH